MSDCENCKFPSAIEQGKNLAFSFINVVGAAFKTGKVVASKEEINRRMEICNGCEFKKDTRCSKCGCFLTYKVGLISETCPEWKW